ncbi:unnamed protein product [Phytophthora fragariaefolia]|uniref:Unnamed protein product n=1 Tax=Phytophthora fragariaefolia TaxID=1490495 RepID=A0A9W6Y2F6_9STRA|nr:unnamed protein product [Phytophthora fragariaefolia]
MDLVVYHDSGIAKAIGSEDNHARRSPSLRRESPHVSEPEGDLEGENDGSDSNAGANIMKTTDNPNEYTALDSEGENDDGASFDDTDGFEDLCASEEEEEEEGDFPEQSVIVGCLM